MEFQDSSFGASSTGWTQAYYRGVMGPNVSLSMKQITDGTSKTVLVGEIRAGLDSTDARGIWAMSGGCASGLYAHGNIGDDNGPNAWAPEADDVFSCNTTGANFGGTTMLNNFNMGCDGGNNSHQQTMRSLHPGGVQSVFCDGSVHWLDDTIGLGTSSTALGVWDLINLSNDSQQVNEDAY